MTMWAPELTSASRPVWRAIAEALDADIRSGRLPPGTRLPTHRQLAKRLGVTVGTVTRAYAEVQRRGYLRGEVGRGSFVGARARSGSEPRLPYEPSYEPGGNEPLLDLGQSVPAVGAEEIALLGGELGRLAAAPELGPLLGSQPPAGAERHRRALAGYLERFSLEVEPERVLLTCGAQHALTISLATLTRPGDGLLCESLTFAGMKSLAALLGLRLIAVELDDRGLRPEALEEAARVSGARVLYTIPTLHNPTSSILPLERRQALVEIAERHDLSIVEDDVYGFLPAERPPPLAALLPERTLFLAGASKLVGPGLRVGLLAAPSGRIGALAEALWATAWMAPPLLVELLARFTGRGEVDALIARRRREARARYALASRVLGDVAPWQGHPEGFHLWLELPEPWSAADFVERARRRGIAVAPAQLFAADRRSAPRCVRLSLSAVADPAELERGLRGLKELLEGEPGPAAFVA